MAEDGCSLCTRTRTSSRAAPSYGGGREPMRPARAPSASLCHSGVSIGPPRAQALVVVFLFYHNGVIQTAQQLVSLSTCILGVECDSEGGVPTDRICSRDNSRWRGRAVKPGAVRH